MRVSTTERQLFKRCRRKWDFSSYNRQALSPIINAPALDLGTLIHLVLAEWTADPTLDVVSLYGQRAVEQQNRVIDSYTSRIGCAPNEAELEPTQQAMLLGMHMIQNYKDRWRSPLPAGFTLIENELALIQDVPGTEHCGCVQDPLSLSYCHCPTCTYDKPVDTCNFGTLCQQYNCVCSYHQLECTFDGVMADEHGDLYIIERKTFSRTPNIDELNNNDQFLAYQWALTQQFPNVVGVAYDGLLKKQVPPANKSKDDLFLRRILLRPQHELQEFQSLLALELLEMANPNVPIYKTVPPVQGCQRWECQFLDVCHAMSKGEPYEHMLQMFVKSDRKRHLEIAEVE